MIPTLANGETAMLSKPRASGDDPNRIDGSKEVWL